MKTIMTRHRIPKGRLAVAGLAALGTAALVTASPAGAATGPSPVPLQAGWASAGQNNHNTRDAATEHMINTGNVGKLAPKWTFTTAGDVSATATVVDGVVYVPDWGGKLWAINAQTGKAIWSRSISDYDGIAGDVSRTSPAYWHGELVIGTGTISGTAFDSSYELGINARTGALLWKTEVDDNPATIGTGSPTVDDGVVYLGTSSKDEGQTTPPTFRGSIEALNATTGKMMWKTYTVPQGYTGGAVWGSNPTVDHKTGELYIATGNNYSSPAGVCLSPGQGDCVAPAADDHIDSIMGLNLKTGAVDWATPTISADTWTKPAPNGAPDYDFGSQPSLYTTTVNGQSTDLIGVGQKSGMYWALNPTTGAVVWQTQVGPGSSGGGIEWGSATDGTRIYAAIGNGNHLPYTLTSYNGTQSTTTGGLWAALDAATGKIEWQTADPQQAVDPGFVSTANGVMYAGSGAATGNNMYALDARTGQIKWAFPSGGSVYAGASIVNGTIYWGSGYRSGGNNDKLYAFSLNGR